MANKKTAFTLPEVIATAVISTIIISAAAFAIRAIVLNNSNKNFGKARLIDLQSSEVLRSLWGETAYSRHAENNANSTTIQAHFAPCANCLSKVDFFYESINVESQQANAIFILPRNDFSNDTLRPEKITIVDNDNPLPMKLDSSAQFLKLLKREFGTDADIFTEFDGLPNATRATVFFLRNPNQNLTDDANPEDEKAIYVTAIYEIDSFKIESQGIEKMGNLVVTQNNKQMDVYAGQKYKELFEVSSETGDAAKEFSTMISMRRFIFEGENNNKKPILSYKMNVIYPSEEKFENAFKRQKDTDPNTGKPIQEDIPMTAKPVATNFDIPFVEFNRNITRFNSQFSGLNNVDIRSVAKNKPFYILFIPNPNIKYLAYEMSTDGMSTRRQKYNKMSHIAYSIAIAMFPGI